MTDPDDELIESWQRAIWHRADGTRELYAHSLGMFRRWLTSNATGSNAYDLLGVRRGHIEAWFTDQAKAGLATNTIRSRWVALRSFYGWLAEEEEIDTNPMERVKVARPDPPPPPVLEAAAVKAMLRAAEGRGFYERRDTAILRVFLATGARLAEVAGLTLADVDLGSRVVTITRGKGGRRRVARIDAATAAAVDRYRRTRSRHRNASRPELWLGLKGPLTASGITAALDRRATEAGVDGFHPHLLRHWWAHTWQTKGGSEASMQVLGGWQDPSVMRRYGAARQVDRALAHYDELDLLGDL